MYSSFGYEPSNRKSSNDRDYERDGQRVPTNLINVLPKLIDYNPTSRIEFKNALVGMLKVIGATSLLMNKRCKVINTQPLKAARRALNTPFTPAAAAAEEEPEESRFEDDSDLDPGPRQVLWRSPHVHTPRAHPTYERVTPRAYEPVTPRAYEPVTSYSYEPVTPHAYEKFTTPAQEPHAQGHPQSRYQQPSGYSVYNGLPLPPTPASTTRTYIHASKREQNPRH